MQTPRAMTIDLASTASPFATGNYRKMPLVSQQSVASATVRVSKQERIAALVRSGLLCNEQAEPPRDAASPGADDSPRPRAQGSFRALSAQSRNRGGSVRAAASEAADLAQHAGEEHDALLAWQPAIVAALKAAVAQTGAGATLMDCGLMAYAARLRRLPKYRTLYREGSRVRGASGAGFFVLLDGAMVLETGGGATQREVLVGECFGISDALAGRTRTTSALVVRPSLVAQLLLDVSLAPDAAAGEGLSQGVLLQYAVRRLGACSLLAGAEPSALLALARMVRPRELLTAGSVLIAPGSVPEAAFVIAHGAVVITDKDGRTHTERASPDSAPFVGANALFDRRPSPLSVATRSAPTLVLVIEARHHHRLQWLRQVIAQKARRPSLSYDPLSRRVSRSVADWGAGY